MLKFEWILYVFNSYIRFLLIFIEAIRWDPPLLFTIIATRLVILADFARFLIRRSCSYYF